MNPECLEYIEILDGLDTYEEQRKDNEFSTLDAEGEIDLIVQNLPFWVKELHTVVLNQIVNRNLIVIKAISLIFTITLHLRSISILIAMSIGLQSI